MMRILTILTLLLSAIFTTSAASVAEQADAAYQSKDFNRAVRLYYQALNTDGASPVIYYNMGNAYYRIGNLGRAIISYERALKLDPTMDDARANLNFVRTKILDKPEDDSTFFDNLHSSVVSWFTPNTWAWISLLLFILLLSTIALYMFAPAVNARKAGFFGGIIVLVVFIYSLTIAIGSVSAISNHNTAVIIVPTANLTSAPGATNASDKVVPVHEGTKLQIIDSVSTPEDRVSPLWYNVKINNSTRAWVRATDIEKI